MQADEGAQSLLRVLNGPHRSDYPLIGDVQGVAHDVEQHLVLALKMVVEAALAELQRRGHVIHRGGIVAALLEQARGRAQDVLARVERSFASHARHGTEERRGMPTPMPSATVKGIPTRVKLILDCRYLLLSTTPTLMP